MHLLFYRIETSFLYDKNAPRGSHCGGMVECRLRDPPQAENPVEQDSFLLYRKVLVWRTLDMKRARTEAGMTSR